jgi:hypothetical protein
VHRLTRRLADFVRGFEVEIRAFRGSRRAPVYREHVLEQRRFRQILAAGERHGLDLLSSLDPNGPHELVIQPASR